MTGGGETPMKLGEWLLFGLAWLALLVLLSDALFNIFKALAKGSLY